MIRCGRCVMPNTRPDTPFVDGVCAACLSYERRPTIDWDARKAELVKLLDRHDGRCIVPSSGGKDSTYQVMTLLELGADVTVVTATTCHLTRIGRRNIDNLARHARTIEVTPNQTVRKKLNRLGLKMVGDISWPEHCAIFSTPFRMSEHLGIPLLFYGENPQDQYGGPMGTHDAKVMTMRWRAEFGGFLGLRPQDLVGIDGLSERDMDDYEPPSAHWFVTSGIEAHFLGQYLPWDSWHNASVASRAGFKGSLPTPANWWWFENLDNAQTGIHDYLMHCKFGFGRGCQQVSVDIRTGRAEREKALRWVEQWDGAYPHHYAGVEIGEVLERIGMASIELETVVEQFSDVDF